MKVTEISADDPRHKDKGVPRYDVIEVVLNSKTEYANPFKDVTVSAMFTAPSGRPRTVEGFYDGGNRWRVRFAPDEVGDWWYITLCTDAANATLHGHCGTFVCIASANKGFIRPDPDHPYYFAYDDGSPFFALGDTATLATPALSDANRAAFLDARAGKPFNFLRMFTSLTFNAWTGEPWSGSILKAGGFPWAGTPDAPDYDRLNPLYFQRYERILREITAKGMHAEIIVYNMYEHPFKQPDVWTQKRETLWGRYVIARFAANTGVFLWTVAQEYERYPDGRYHYDPSDDAWARRMGALIHSADPYHHPVSVHPWGHLPDQRREAPLEAGEIGRRFGNSRELDVLTHQHNSYDTGTYQEAYELRYWDGPASGVDEAIRADRKYGKPVINTEYGYEWLADYAADFNRQRHGTDKCRRAAWRIFTAGGAGFAAGFAGTTMSMDLMEMYHDGTRKLAPFRVADMGHAQHLGVLFAFVNRTDFREMNPQQALVNDPNLCLANPGLEYVVYAPSGGDIAIDLSGASGEFVAEWLDPRTGAYRALENVKGSGTQTFAAPDADDWVLHLTKA